MTHPGDLLSAYLDDELNDDERAAVAAHLQTCGDCRDELTAVQSAAVAIRSLPALDAPPGLVPAPAAWRKRRRWQTLGAATAGVAAIVTLVVGVAVIGDNDEPPLVAADTVPVVLPGLDSVLAGDSSVNGQQRVQALEAAFRTMDGVEEMERAADEMSADVEVMMHDEPMKIRAGMWDGVAAEYLAVMTPAEGVIGLFVAAEDGIPMAFFYCEHSWYRVHTGSGQAPPVSSVTALRGALGCES
ncbi:MAG: anti-sigma factor [Acidimicrobiia bacterium]